jgi:hypothetical protein
MSSSEVKIGAKSWSPLKEHGLLLALQPDVELEAVTLGYSDQRGAPVDVGDFPEQRIAGVGGLFVGKVAARPAPLHQAPRKDRDFEMRSLAVINGSGLRRQELVGTLRVGAAAPKALPPGRDLTGRRGLLDLDDRVRNRFPGAIEEAPTEQDGVGKSRTHQRTSVQPGESKAEEGADGL